jgi:outer membrane lipoprotein SlyB
MSRVGDTFTTVLANDLMGPIGVVIPKGTVATAQIAALGKNVNLDMRSLAFAGHTYSIESDVTYTEIERVRRKSPASRNRIAAGAGIGAVAGGVLGGNPATTVLGAAAGGVAGAVTSKRSVRDDACIPEGGRINVRLVDPLKLALTE